MTAIITTQPPQPTAAVERPLSAHNDREWKPQNIAKQAKPNHRQIAATMPHNDHGDGAKAPEREDVLPTKTSARCIQQQNNPKGLEQHRNEDASQTFVNDIT
jgi:hypothetical protein